ncbi:unnamed protein product [Parajaminaea phylloscopi]
MSFPNHYAASPLIQRDYGLISSSYSSATAAPPPLPEVVEDEAAERRSETLASISQADEEEEDGVEDDTSSRHDAEDSMSHISMEGHQATGSIGRQGGARRSTSGSSGRISATPAAATTTAAYSVQTRRPAGDIESQEQHAVVSPHSIGGILSTSLLLGGDAAKPPPGADLRTEEEARRDGDGAEWEDNDPTPMPANFRALQDQWIMRPPLTRQRLEEQERAQQQQQQQQQQYSDDVEHDTPTPTETTSLLAASRPTVGTSEGASARGPSPSGYQSVLSERRTSNTAASHPPGPAAQGSAWSIADLSAPHVPTAEQVNETSAEPRDHLNQRELTVLTKYSLPVWGTHLLELSLNVVSVFSIGHLGTIQLAAASLSSMTANVTAFSLLSGFISALDSLLPPAFTQQPKRVGIYTQSMGIIVAFLCIPITVMWLNAEKLLLALGQNAEVARLSGIYLRYMLPGVPAYAGFEVCRRYLQAQGLMSASTVVLFVVSPLNAVLNYLLVWGPDSIRLGFIGAPLASAFSNWLMFILALGQCYIAPRTAWGGFSLSSALKSVNLMPCLSLGFYGFMAISSEWWAWEISSLITSLLGTTPLAAQSVLLVCSSITYQQPFAISVAAAVRVGNLLGALKPQDARISANAAYVLSVLSGIFNSSLLVIFRRPIASLFSEDAEVIELLITTLPLLALFQVADGISGVSGGIMRGTGRQHLAAYLNMVSYYVISLPLGAYLTLKTSLGLPGMWIGLTTALAVSSVGGLWLVSRTDWDVEVRKVQARMDGYVDPSEEQHDAPAGLEGRGRSSSATSGTASAQKVHLQQG